MLTTREVIVCEGYYLETKTGDILRNVLPEPNQCENDEEGTSTDIEAFPPTARFERISSDVTLPLTDVIAMAERWFEGDVSGKLINRQTAIQSDGTLITEVAEST